MLVFWVQFWGIFFPVSKLGAVLINCRAPMSYFLNNDIGTIVNR